MHSLRMSLLLFWTYSLLPSANLSVGGKSPSLSPLSLSLSILFLFTITYQPKYVHHRHPLQHCNKPGDKVREAQRMTMGWFEANLLEFRLNLLRSSFCASRQIRKMRFCSRLSICFSTMQSSKKTGWGGYRLHRKSEHFVGTEPSLVKYHDIPDKKPTQPYGLQGTNHLLPGFGKIAAKLPTRTILLKDKIYAWCNCGYSRNQPLCDGTHLTIHTPKWAEKLRPVRYIPDRDMEVWLCNCKHTKNRPFCDGSHKKFLDEEKRDVLADD